MRFSAIKKSYAVGMHFEPTRGNKQQAEAYINKFPPFDENGETVSFVCREGEVRGAQGKRTESHTTGTAQPLSKSSRCRKYAV